MAGQSSTDRCPTCHSTDKRTFHGQCHFGVWRDPWHDHHCYHSGVIKWNGGNLLCMDCNKSTLEDKTIYEAIQTRANSLAEEEQEIL